MRSGRDVKTARDSPRNGAANITPRNGTLHSTSRNGALHSRVELQSRC